MWLPLSHGSVLAHILEREWVVDPTGRQVWVGVGDLVSVAEPVGLLAGEDRQSAGKKEE